MKLFYRIEVLVVVSALVICAAGCKSNKSKAPNPYTGLMSGRGNVPPAYVNVAPIPRNAATPSATPATFNEIGGDNAFVVPNPTVIDAPAEATVATDDGLIGGISESEIAPVVAEAPAVSAGMRKLPEVPATPAVVAGEIYVVKSGDSLSKIAAAYGVKTTDVMALNPGITSADKIKVGQKLTMPAGAKAKAVPASSKSSSGKGTSSSKKSNIAQESIPADGKYSVRSGDSLWIIARRFNLTSNDIRTWNNLSSDNLQVGQELILKGSAAAPAASAAPAAPVAAPTADVAAPAVSVGAVDAAAVTAPVADAVAPVVAEEVPQERTFAVIVGPNDTLDTLASLYETTKEAILQANPQIRSDADLRPDMTINMVVKPQ